MAATLNHAELAILAAIQTHLRCGILDAVFPFLTHLNDAGVLWIAIAVILVSRKRTRTAGLCMAACLLVNLTLGEGLIKHLINRPRPFAVQPIANMLVALPTTSSFPSGHTSSSFAAATSLFYHSRRAGVLAYIMASLIAFSRLYLYLHYPTDVLAGIVLGTCVGVIVTPFVSKKLHRSFS